MHLKLRTDLVFSAQESGGESMVVVKDPLRSRFYRFQEAELFIAQQLDGATPPEEVQRRTQERFGAELDAESLGEFVKTLERYGLLESGQPVEAQPAHHTRDLFYMRFRAFNPERLFDRLIGRVRFCFTPQFITLSAAVMVFAAVIMVTSWPEIMSELKQLNLFHALLTAWGLALVIGVFHEFAHGLTCTHFGGRVREVGFYLLYLNPALYCNVSDAWMFPKKSQKLWVTVAGSYIEVFLWAIATLVWSLADVGTLPNRLALIAMMTTGVKTLFNFNPLIKLDGYYLLSDILEIPNLRKKSFRYLGSHIRRFFGARVEPERVSLRERRIFIAYGICATLFMVVFLWFTAFKLGAALLPGLQAVGFLIVTFLIFQRLKKRWKSLAGSSGRRSSRSRGTGAELGATSKVDAPDAAAGSTGRSAGRKDERTQPLWWKDRRRMLPAGAVLVLVVFGGCLELKVTGEIVVLPKHNADVHAQVDGLVAQVLVSEGQQVSAGQVLARLSDREYRAELAKTDAELEERRAKLRMLETGARPEERSIAAGDLQRARLGEELAVTRFEEAGRQHAEKLVKAKSSVRMTEERLKFARNNVERLRALRDAQVLSQKEFETTAEQLTVRETEYEAAVAELNIVMADNLTEAQRNLASAQRDLAQVEGRVRLMQAGTREEELAATGAEVQRLESQQRYLQDQMRLTEIRSTLDGVVTTPARLLAEMPGRYIKKGDLIAEVFELKTIQAEIAVPEKEIAEIQVGQRVLVKARAFPNRVFEGRVSSIATTAHGPVPNNPSSSASTGTQGRAAVDGRYVLVTTQLENESLLLKPEMTGKAKVLCGKRRIFELLTRRVSRTFRVEFWSWW